MIIKSHHFLRKTLLAAALALGVPGVAAAQQQPAPPEQPAQPQDPAAPADQPAPSDQPADQGMGAPAQDPGATQPAPVTPAPVPAAPAPAPAPAPEPAPAVEPAPAPAAPSDDVVVEAPYTGEEEVIVVTGSVIERKDLTTPAPLAIVDKAELDASGLVSIGDILQNLPSQSNAINVQANNGGDGSTRISLRGLGSGRTLVLVNGRRHVPGGTGANSSVDLNAIPMAVIERVEVLKDGASAVYGSDAIGGVVNIITRTDYKETEAVAYTGSTTDGLGQIYDVSVATGHSSKRGNIIFSAGYYQQNEINAGDREYSKSDKFYDWATGDVYTSGSSAVPQGYIRDRGEDDTGNQAWQDLVADGGPCSTAPYTCFNDPVVGWRDFNTNGNWDVGEGDFYNYQPENYLITPQQRYNVFSSGTYDLSDSVRGFFEASYTNRRSDQRLAPEPLFTITEGLVVAADNYYNPFDRNFVDVRRRFVEAGPRRFLQNIDTFRVVGGVEGKLPTELLNLPKGWRWNLSYNFGRTQGTDVNEGRLVRSRLAQAIGPSYVGTDNLPHCGTEASPGPEECVPLDLFGGEGSITPEMLKYITYTGTAFGFTQQRSVQANVTGKLFETPWGGDVALGLGAEYRDEAGGYEPDPNTASGDTTGNKGEPTSGTFDVYEAYGELSAVPVMGKEFAEWVELTAAVRAFNYSTFGSDFTWKLGGLWRPVKGFSLRGTYSTAFRAPSIGQLYSGQADGFPSVTDPCDTSQGERSPTVNANCQADGLPDDYVDDRFQIRSLVGGNPDLQPETANIFTVGTVFEPQMVPGLALTVDYFNINLDNSIQAAGASVILSNCYAQETRSNCDQIIRDNTGFITVIVDTETNIGGVDTAGVDFNIRYNHNTTMGRFVHNLEGTWLQKYNNTQADGRVVEGKGVYDLGVFPTWKFNYSTLWNSKEWGAGINARYIHSFEECEDDDCSGDNIRRDVSANVTADLFGTYTLASGIGKSRLTVGINNVLNQQPAVIYNGFLATSDSSTYDFLGRYFYARLMQTF